MANTNASTIQTSPKPYQSPEGSHRHECGDCGYVWEHSNKCRGNDAAHQCPKCGEEEWGQYFGEKPPTNNYTSTRSL